MKKLFNILMMVAVIACSVGCNPDDPVVVDPENINAIKTAYTIGAEGGSLELQVSANFDFTVTCADTWVKYSTTKANETKTVVVTVEPNTSTESRTTTVTVAGKEKKAEIKITQEGAAPVEPDILEAGTTTYNVPADGGEVNVAVTTNVDMTVKADASWIKYTSTKAASQKTVCFTIEANTAYEARTGKATISGGDKTVEIVFNQAAAIEPDPDRLEVSKTDYEIGAEGGSVEVAVSTNSEVSATTSQSWAKYVNTKAKRDMVNKTLVFSVEANTAYEERTVTATITAGDQSATVTIKQAAAQKPDQPDEPDEPTEDPVLSAGQATYTVPAEGQDIVVDVTTNVEYTVSCDAQWITKVATKATRTDHITFTVAANEGEARSAQIKFNYGEITVVVTVSQEAYVAPEEDPVLELSATEFQTTAEGGDFSVKVTHNYDYTVTGAPEWVDVDIDGDDCFITVAENKEPEARTATLTFASKGLSKSFAIAQEAAAGSTDPFNVGPNLSVNGTANCYVVTKAGNYYFNATVMGNGEEGWLDDWDEFNEMQENDFNMLYPESKKALKISAKQLNADAVKIVWQEGNCIENAALSDDKTVINFTATGNVGNAVITLTNKYDEVVWSWHIWCTDTPAEQKLANEDNEEFILLDRNIGATSANPADGAATYGLWYQNQRKDPLKAKEYINRDFADNNNWAGRSMQFVQQNPTLFYHACGRTCEWYNGWLIKASGLTIHQDLWGNPFAKEYLPNIAGEPADPDVSELVKTVYDPCPVGYMVPPRTAYTGIRARRCQITDFGVKVPGVDGDIFFPFAGYADSGDSCGEDSGWYGYAGYIPPKHSNPDFHGSHLVYARNEGLIAAVWSSNAHQWPNDSNWMSGTSAQFTVPPVDEGTDYTPSGVLEFDYNYGHIRIAALPVRCMKIPTE